MTEPPHLRTLFSLGAVGGLTDGELLGRFAAGGGETAELAFAALVARHGPTVLRVCRTLLRHEHDAQDAFQATFLVLARKAAAVRKRDSVASWLYGVALRTSSCARSASARRRSHERRAAGPEAVDPDRGSRPWEAEVFHEEIGRLPDRYRAAIVLCHLEGVACEEAARWLGWPVGTVKSRLARGRERLRARLIRRGLAPAGVPILMKPAGEGPLAPVPDVLAGAAARLAVAGTLDTTFPAAPASLAGAVLRGAIAPEPRISAEIARSSDREGIQSRSRTSRRLEDEATPR